MKHFYKFLPVSNGLARAILGTFLVFVSAFAARAQCPPNIDFETGTFNFWKTWVGTVADVGGTNVITLTQTPLPVPGQHDMLSAVPGDGRDAYGLFPVNCPNGSGHSIKLGNNSGGAQAEGVSYEFTIPATANKFNLIYYYAVVFQDPGHLAHQQPRLEIEVFNVTDNTTIGCSSFSFIATSSLPGFFQSANPQGPTPVWCKNWSANTVTLDGNQGKTIRVFFKTADCTFNAHFGYAYVDVATQCSSSFIGATFCPDDTAVTVTAPFGYQNYTWWDATYTTILGTTQSLYLNPPPLSGATVNCEIVPFAGYGCKDTLTAVLMDTLTVNAIAGPDRYRCDATPVQIGVNPEPGLVYKWDPPAGLSDPNISNPLANPANTTRYILTVTNNGGGCLTTDTVDVFNIILDTTLTLIGSASYCTASGQSAVLQVNPADSIQWWRNGVAIPGAIGVQYIVTQSGAYHAEIISFAGCTKTTRVQQIDIYESPVPGFTVPNPTQCFANNQFVFTNTSTISAGNLSYAWNMGDGSPIQTTADVTYSYATPGVFTVTMVVTADNGCKDSSSTTITVNEGPVSGFNVNALTQCFKNNSFVFTNSSTLTNGTMLYSWDLGDGSAIQNTRNVTYSYGAPGTYNVKMKVRSAIGSCEDSTEIAVTVDPSPIAGFGVDNAQQCQVNNRFTFTNSSTINPVVPLSYNWDMGDGSPLQSNPNIVYSYSKAGDYIVKLVVLANSCIDSFSMPVRVHAQPTADFSVKDICVQLPVPVVNKTVNNTTSTLNFLWDFGNGFTSTQTNPVYSYPAPGNYKIKLSVNTPQCPAPLSTKELDIVIDAPAKGIVYPLVDAVINFPEPLSARPFGVSAVWTPATSLDNRYSYKPVFRGALPQLYTIEIRTATGCVTVDTQMVKTHKKIAIYVPTVFTPAGSNGLNDLLRPLLMGFEKVNYFRVFNRWGQLMFEMKSDRPGWDGRWKGQIQEMQAVVWMIEAVDVDGRTHKQQGTTLLVK